MTMEENNIQESHSITSLFSEAVTKLAVCAISLAIVMYIENALREVLNDINNTYSNNYLFRYGTKARQEKFNQLAKYKIQNKKIKSYTQLRHYKRYPHFPVLGRGKD